MTEQVEPPADDFEPVSKRTRRSGVVKSIGDPLLVDRSKVASIFLSMKEKQEKQYRKDTELLRQSTQMRMNDWKSVIGVEKDASKICPVFRKAQQAVSIVKPIVPPQLIMTEAVSILPLVDCSIVPDPYEALFESPLIPIRPRSRVFSNGFDPETTLHQTLFPGVPVVDLFTPCKPPLVSPDDLTNLFPDIDRSVQAACLTALATLPPDSYFPPFPNSKVWSALRQLSGRQHSLAKSLSKWRDEDAAVRRNKVAPVWLVVGPTGCGKTSLVYACCAEVELEVLEVSPAEFSWEANGKRPMGEAAKEALQSRRAQTSSCCGQIVLIDDVDVLVHQDRSVMAAIAAMTSDSKRPLVLTATSHDALGDLADEIFHIQAPSEKICAFLIGAYRAHRGSPGLPRTALNAIAATCNRDLRRVAMNAAEMDPIIEKGVENENSFICKKLDLMLLIQPFIASWMIKPGETTDMIRLMAQLSNAPAFSSRRVRCILDPFNAQDHVLALRAMQGAIVLVHQDRSVMAAIAAMTSDSKRPLVLTATSHDALGDLADEIFHIQAPSEKICAFLIGAYRAHRGSPGLPRTALNAIAATCNRDLRRVAMNAAEMDLSC